MKAIERVYKYIDYKKLKPIPFEKKINLSNGYLGKQKRRNADLGEGILNKIIENCPEINPTWLLTGKGSMLLDNNNDDVVSGSPAVAYKEPPLHSEIQSLKERIKDKEKIISLQEDKIEKDRLQIENLRQKVRQLKELLEKKNADYKPMGVGTSLPTEPAANKPCIMPAEKKIKRPRK